MQWLVMAEGHRSNGSVNFVMNWKGSYKVETVVCLREMIHMIWLKVKSKLKLELRDGFEDCMFFGTTCDCSAQLHDS